ncbi:hypothetical protein HW555_000367 [Spodoptera exigua]|uniref:Uncharacterized protein n=1 Tax=Spodoptera exigua TaxID=7107 RepID=A0A835GS02_SPOEX|nr:hypothetical protein HW555_000367 [Spodoptera exigua]
MARTALVIISFILAIVPCFCQRPFYAGLRPIGFPETPVATGIFDRFPDEPIPAQLNGDRNYANLLNALPQDNQPFFFLNKDKVAESLKNPQTYPQRPNHHVSKLLDLVTGRLSVPGSAFLLPRFAKSTGN